jgi:ABC-type antimicrobial peptide transport system permease subunit
LIERLRRELEPLRRENERPKKELDAVRRAGKRQAAPFSKGAPMLSATVTRRTLEIGVRTALGATRVRIARLVAGQTAVVFTSGLALGGVGYAIAGHLIQSQPFGVALCDLRVVGATVGALTMIAAAAVWIPSRRAMRISLAEALRHQEA